ncbi:MAG: FAD:protein FMN transferase [Candidatus Obscuribacterales bacterium]|nr:FAD:protein FMN transferase [Steroidobacteraceae bacterium]
MLRLTYRLLLAARVLLPSLFLLSACTAPTAAHREFLAMGSTVSVTLVDVKHSLAQTALGQIETEVQQWSRDWYPWNASGELAQLNAALASGQTFDVRPELAALLQRSQELFRLSDGAFDPAVAPMVERWGFHAGERASNAVAPNAEHLAAWRAHRATLADLRIDGRRISSSRRELMLDLGAIGKGRAVDLAIERLRSYGIARALVNAGGNMRGIGAGPKRAWRVAIKDPRSATSLGWIELRDDESISTSGDYERFALVEGKRAHHLLDPRAGSPATHTAAVTVLAGDATLADAASTAVFVAGPTEWRNVARRLGITDALRVEPNGKVEISRSLRARFHVSQLTVNMQVVDL